MGDRTRVGPRGRLTLALGALAAFAALASVAYADDISNNVDGTLDPEAEVMPFTIGGAPRTTVYAVTPRNGDGKSGCNLTGSSTLGVSVNTSNASVATVSPAALTFDSCGALRTVTVTVHAIGSATISLLQTSNNTGGAFNFEPAAFTVTVAPPPNEAPSISVTGVTSGASYEKGSVPAATCEVTDDEDGNSSFGASLSAVSGPNALDGLGVQTASCSYTDAGGITAAASVTYGVVDPSGPTIDKLVTGTEGTSGWYTSDVVLTWLVTDAESPNSLAKTGCVDQGITADQGATTYTCSATSAGGTAGPVSVVIKRDATNPTIGGSSNFAPNAHGWSKTDVLVSFACDDALSGVASCTSPVTLSSDGDGLSVTGTAVDNAGNSAGATVSGIRLDTTPPTVSGATSPSANAAGWHRSDVIVSFTCDDALSGIDTCSPDATLTGEGASLSATGSALDKAGNTASTTVGGIKIDRTVPTIGGAATPAPNANGWNRTDVTVTFTCADALSGVASCSPPATLSTEGTGLSATGTAVDNADNLATRTVGGLKLDKTDPTFAWNGGPTAGASYYYGLVPGAPTCTASDALSGPDGCSVAGYGAGVGEHTMTATAHDKASNTATGTRTYTVLAWTLSGFFQPVDMGGVQNTVKNGSTVPLKFRIHAGSTELTDTAAVRSLTYAQTACEVTATTDEIETVATGGTSLRYDATGGQYVYNWKTPATAGKCYRVTMLTQDGSSLVAYFKLK
jgi:hypothetical protein